MHVCVCAYHVYMWGLEEDTRYPPLWLSTLFPGSRKPGAHHFQRGWLQYPCLSTPTLTQVLAAIPGFLHECCEFEFRFSRLHKYFYPLSYLPSPQQQLLTPDSQTGLLQMLQLTLKICSLARLFVILIAINNNINNR